MKFVCTGSIFEAPLLVIRKVTSSFSQKLSSSVREPMNKICHIGGGGQL